MDDELIPVETEKPPKERVKLTHSTWAKVGAIVLLYVSLICVLICAVCYIANVEGLGNAEYVQENVIDFLDFTQPGAMTIARIVWNASSFCGASVLRRRGVSAADAGLYALPVLCRRAQKGRDRAASESY